MRLFVHPILDRSNICFFPVWTEDRAGQDSAEQDRAAAATGPSPPCLPSENHTAEENPLVRSLSCTKEKLFWVSVAKICCWKWAKRHHSRLSESVSLIATSVLMTHDQERIKWGATFCGEESVLKIMWFLLSFLFFLLVYVRRQHRWDVRIHSDPWPVSSWWSDLYSIQCEKLKHV